MIQETGVDIDELYNFDQLKEIAAGNPDFIKSLASIYLTTVPADSAEMLEAAKTGDWMRMSKLAHKLKSTIDNMNILTLKTDIRSLEMDGKNKTNTAALLPLAQKAHKILGIVAEQVKADFQL